MVAVYCLLVYTNPLKIRRQSVLSQDIRRSETSAEMFQKNSEKHLTSAFMEWYLCSVVSSPQRTQSLTEFSVYLAAEGIKTLRVTLMTPW